ncbi:MAG: hypothetical protein IH868_05505 [Chloroflexi bacterium]|nr:hypothetical protein [Chloroflexota bacterium]
MTTAQHRIAQTVREYDAQGVHRTGTAVDLASAHWLAEQAQARGYAARLEPFALNRVVPAESFLEFNGEKIDGIPLFDGTFTDETGIEGKLGPAGSGADIAVVDFAPSGPDALNEARRSGKHAALVGVVPSDPPGLAIRNAPEFGAPFGPPVLQVSSAEHQRLIQAAAAGPHARLVAHATTETTDAHNVVVEIPGMSPDLPPLIVMTPRSGWFNCAAERGGGIACWLEIISTFQNDPPNRNVTLIATSGHELGHLGLESYIEHNPELPTQAATWLHLGASIGAAMNWKPHLQTSDRELETAALDCLAGPEFEGLPELTVHPTGQVFGGEAQQIHSRGGRYVSIVGGHALFHQEADRWPDAVNMPALTAYADALAALAVRLAAR